MQSKRYSNALLLKRISAFSGIFLLIEIVLVSSVFSLEWEFLEPSIEANVHDTIDLGVRLINPSNANESVYLDQTYRSFSTIATYDDVNTLVGAHDGVNRGVYYTGPYNLDTSTNTSIDINGITLSPGDSIEYSLGSLEPIDNFVNPGSYTGKFLVAPDYTSTTNEYGGYLYTDYKPLTVNIADWYQAIDVIEPQRITDLSTLTGSNTPSFFNSLDISFVDQDVLIDIDIRLVGDDPGQDLLDQWENGIEGIWSDGFDIVDHGFTYDINFNVDFVSAIHINRDYVVTVHEGAPDICPPLSSCPPADDIYNMANWYTDASHWDNLDHNIGPYPYNHMQDEIAAHEFGHMMGLYDEYTLGVQHPTNPITRDDSIMGRLGPPLEDHYAWIVEWLEGASGREGLALAPAPFPTYQYDSPGIPFTDGPPGGTAPVPEPATCLLFGTGLVGLLGIKRKLSNASN